MVMVLSNGLKAAAAGAALIGTASGGVFVLEDRYEKQIEAEKVKQVVAEIDQKLEVKIVTDDLYQTKERIWELEDRQAKRPNDIEVKKDLRELNVRKEQLEKDLEEVKKK